MSALTHPHTLSDVSYAHLTVSPDEAQVPLLDLQQPLPAMIEPLSFPREKPQALSQTEPVIRIQHPRIQNLEAYREAGWKHFTDDTLMRTGAVARLYRAAEALPEGFGFAVFDAWRPLCLQREIYQASYSDPSLPPGFVTEPSTDPEMVPPHMTGGTVDLTLTWLRQPLALGTDFDDFTGEAAADAFENRPGQTRELRRMLYWAMQTRGFRVISCEWWHFEIGTRRWAALSDRPAPHYRNAPLTSCKNGSHCDG